MGAAVNDDEKRKANLKFAHEATAWKADIIFEALAASDWNGEAAFDFVIALAKGGYFNQEER